ncbi:MAG: hypothetical protein JW384_03624 [Nitrosomonadaceae bacterium]|nr:hypothetical protein [Nitrosomonadaceae bacterium]
MKQHAALLIILALLVAGCAFSAKPEAMISTLRTQTHQSTSNVAVVVSEATVVTKLQPVRILDEDFAQAMRESLEKTGLFAAVVAGNKAAYVLDVFFVQVYEQIFGLDMTASLDVTYTLASTTPKKALWEKTIHTEHTATFSDALISINRLQIAVEGAARRNIEQSIQEISKLQLK